MKMNTKLVLVLTFMLVVSSCNDSDIIVENANSGISIDKSRQLNLTPDEKLHKEQSSLENMLMDQIIYRDSAYILNMSKEEDGSIVIDLAGDYYGEIDFRMQYKSIKGDTFDWLYIDFQTLSLYASECGFKAELVKEGKHYDYLAKLSIV